MKRQRLATARRADLPTLTVLTDRALEVGETVELVIRARVVRIRFPDGERECRYQLEAIDGEVSWDDHGS